MSHVLLKSSLVPSWGYCGEERERRGRGEEGGRKGVGKGEGGKGGRGEEEWWWRRKRNVEVREGREREERGRERVKRKEMCLVRQSI